MIRARGLLAAALLTSALFHASCSAGEEARGAQGQRSAAPPETGEARRGGVPAQPDPEAGPVSDRSRVIGMEDMAAKFPDRGNKPGCFITFVYRGEAPETLIWDGEPCSALTARFANRAFLETAGDWSRLEPSQQADVEKAPGGEVLYVEGQFTASIYPLGLNHLTYEIAVSD